MPQLENQHYVQKRLLDNFARQAKNGKHKVCLLDLCEFTAEYRNTDKAFYSKNLYDTKDVDSKILEKALHDKIENPTIAIVTRILENKNKVILTRSELETLKKYVLIQIYRNYRNMTGYTRTFTNTKAVSEYNIREDESPLDFWKREIKTILDNKWDDVVSKIELVGVKKYAQEINMGFLMFFSTKTEFVVNDLGIVTERIPVTIPENKQKEYIEAAKIVARSYGAEDGAERARQEIENNASYLDNMTFFPLACDFAVAVVNPIWKCFCLGQTKSVPLSSNILYNHLSLPKNTYVNQNLIDANIGGLKEYELIPYYKHPDDTYEYKVHVLTDKETIYINNLTMNEAFRYLCFKTPEGVIPSIREYNRLKSNGLSNMKRDYGGFIDLLSMLKPFDTEQE